MTIREAPGVYKQSQQGHRVFIPAPLPPRLSLPPRVWRSIEEASHCLGQVEAYCSLIPNPELLVYSSLQREALASSTIEGTITTPAELVLFQVQQRSGPAAVREVANYAEALEWGRQQIAEVALSRRVILGLHERLLHGVRREGVIGRYKQWQNFIGKRPGDGIEEAVFVPSPPELTEDLMAQLEAYLNSARDEPRLVQCAAVHYQFEAIHPFADGNGRVGRLLIILQFIQLGLLSAPLIHPSVYFEQTRQEYYQRLHDVHERGAWNEWIEYFAGAIAHQSQAACRFVKAMRELQQQLREQVSSTRTRLSTQEVLQAFFHHPVRSVKDICHYSGLCDNTVRKALDHLQQLGIARELTGKRKRRTYACPPILNAIFPVGTSGQAEMAESRQR